MWKGLSPVAVSFKLRKFKCKIAKKKKMKVKLIAEILAISLCDENHLMLTLMIMMSRAKYQIIIWEFVRWDLLSYHPRSASSSFSVFGGAIPKPKVVKV